VLDTCEKAGMQVTKAEMADACGESSFRLIKFECCKLEPATQPSDMPVLPAKDQSKE
jgi:hypothetical protein